MTIADIAAMLPSPEAKRWNGWEADYITLTSAAKPPRSANNAADVGGASEVMCMYVVCVGMYGRVATLWYVCMYVCMYVFYRRSLTPFKLCIYMYVCMIVYAYNIKKNYYKCMYTYVCMYVCV